LEDNTLKRVITLLTALVFVAGAVSTQQVIDNASPADAASSIYGIHVARAPGIQAYLGLSYDIPSGWFDEFDDAALIISNAAPLVNVQHACFIGYACTKVNTYPGGTGGPYNSIHYVLSGDHLMPDPYGRTTTSINSNKVTSSTVLKVIACDSIMRTLGVADGCLLNGWPSSDGLAVLQYMHNHSH
jgi:hypothetical protein